MEGNRREMSYVEEAAKDGSIFSAWTRKWGLHIRPWYENDKIKFSFVEVGKAGKGNSFDIYMDIIKFGFPCFMKWANDIKSPTGRFERILAAEAKAGEKYPKAYKYVTGEKGHKSIGICNSTNGGYCINASINKGEQGGTVFANIPVDFGDLELIANAFMDGYRARLDQLEAMRFERTLELAKYYEDKDSSKIKAVIDTEQPEFTENTISYPSDAVATEIPEDDNDESPALAPEQTEPVPAGIVRMTVLVGVPDRGNGEFVFNGKNKETGEDVALYVKNETMIGEQKEKWNLLAAVLKEGKRTVTFLVEPGEKNIIKQIA